MPTKRRIIVVLPDPDGPTMVRNSPSRISRSIPSIAVKLPKRLLTLSSRSTTLDDIRETPGQRPRCRGSYNAGERRTCRGKGPDVIAGVAAPAGSAPPSGVVNLDQPVIVGDNAVLDAAVDVLLKFAPLDGLEFLLVKLLHDVLTPHLRHGVVRSFREGHRLAD